MSIHIHVDEYVYQQLKEKGRYEDLFVVPKSTYKYPSTALEILVHVEGEERLHQPDICCMRGTRLGQRRRDWGMFGFNRRVYEYEYTVANKIARRMSYLYEKTGQTVFHIPIKDRWKDNVGHHHLTTRAFVDALHPYVEGMTTLGVDDWHNGLMSFILVKTEDHNLLAAAHSLFRAAHKQFLIDNLGVNTNGTSYPHI